MSRKERVIAGLLLVVAVGGSALIPRLLATPAAPLGIALGPGPRASVVQAPAAPQVADHTSQHTTSVSREAAVTPIAAVTPVAAKPAESTSIGRPKQASGSPTAPPTATLPSNPPPPPTQPAADVRQPPVSVTPPAQAKTPPGQAKKLRGLTMTPPGQAKKLSGSTRTPPGQAKKPHAPGPPPAKRDNEAGRRSAHRDLPGSGHGQTHAQAPPHTVGAHHRGVGHLAPPPSRPAPATRKGGPEARAEDRGRGGKGGEGPSQAQAPVAHGHGHDENGKGDD
jgi:hypothetical protein